MSSFGNVNLASDSESDDSDYDPTKDGAGKNLSEEEDSGDEEEDENGGRKGKSKGKKKKKKEIDSFAEAFAKEKEDIKDAKEKKKVDDLWADFKSGTSSKPKPTSKPVGSGLGSWSSTAKPQASKKSLVTQPKKPVSNVFDSIFGPTSTESCPKPSIEENKPKIIGISSIIDSIFKEREKQNDVDATVEKPDSNNEDVIKITKVFDFAGEAVEVTTEVSKDSRAAQKFLKAQESKSDSSSTAPDASSSTKRPGGIESIMSVIDGKKPKLGTLDKSKMDWEKFVKEEGIKEDLQTFNKGKDGFVEKQLFLERADHRRFEIEKQIREKTRKTFLK